MGASFALALNYIGHSIVSPAEQELDYEYSE